MVPHILRRIEKGTADGVWPCMTYRQIPDQTKNIVGSLSTLTAAVSNISTINNNLNMQYEKKYAECTGLGLRNENIHLLLLVLCRAAFTPHNRTPEVRPGRISKTLELDYDYAQ